MGAHSRPTSITKTSTNAETITEGLQDSREWLSIGDMFDSGKFNIP